MKKYTKEQIIKYLQDKIDTGEITSTSSFKSGMIKLETIYNCLECKNWAEVLEVIDRKDKISFRKHQTKENIEKEINVFIEKNGRFPKTRELWKIADHKTIKKLYGNIENLYKLFTSYLNKKEELSYTKDRLIKYLQEKIDNKEITSTLFFAKKENISLETVFKRLGVNSWKEVLILIDRKNAIKENTENLKEKEKIIQFYKELSIKLCKKNGASVEDIKEHSNYNTFTIAAIFGGMFGLRLAAGYPYIYKKNKIDYTELKKEFKKLYKEIGEVSEAKLIKILKDRGMPSTNTIKRAFKVVSLKDLYELLDNKKRG